jgi:sigma54-dependent transcription regulator
LASSAITCKWNVFANFYEIALDAQECSNLVIFCVNCSIPRAPTLILRWRRRSIADAGRAAFGASRAKRSTINDSDRLRKFLQRFGLNWEAVVDYLLTSQKL